MGAGLRQRERGGVADAARGAGDERDTVGEGKRHRWSLVIPAAQTSLRSLRRLDCNADKVYAVCAGLTATQTSLCSLRRLDCVASAGTHNPETWEFQMMVGL